MIVFFSIIYTVQYMDLFMYFTSRKNNLNLQVLWFLFMVHRHADYTNWLL